MDKNKRRSSIRKTIPSNEEFEGPIRAASTQKKRRISFSGKKSIREFYGEEEPQTWNNSYEVSDHVNNSGGDGQSAITNGQRGAYLLVSQTRDSLSHYSRKMQQRPVPRADKENEFPLQLVTAMKLEAVGASTVLQKLNQNSTLLINNTVDITLLEREKNHRCHLLSISPSESYSISENELIMLREREPPAPTESTITFSKELLGNEQKCDVKFMNIEMDECQQQICNEFEKTNYYAKEMIESLYEEESGESTKIAPTTIIMNETISEDSENSVKGTLMRRTMRQMKDMDISLSMLQQQPQQNMNDNKNSKFVSNEVLDMDIESPLSKKAHRLLEEVVCVQEAAVNFEDKLNSISLQYESDESAKFVEEFRDLLLKPKVQESKHYDTSMEISMKSPINILDIREQQSKTLTSNTFCDNMEVSLEATIADEKPCKKISKTILFNNNNASDTMEISIANEPQVSQQESVEPQHKVPFKVDMNKNVAPKVIVMRKTCTPKIHKESDYKDFEKQRLKRFKEKQKQDQQKKEAISTQPVVNAEPSKDALCSHKNSALNFSLQSSNNGIFSPENSSPLFPPEYIALSNKKPTFRQLNDDIERGKIKIFPEIPKRPSISKHCDPTRQKNQLHGISSPKCKGILNFEEDVQPSASEPLLDSNKGIMENKYFGVIDKEELAGKKPTVRYSQADDILLDNTSFLTHAKLGDETASRNNSKCSSSSRRETIIFNTKIEMELEENCVAEGDPNEMAHEKSTYKQNHTCVDVDNLSKMPDVEIGAAIGKCEILSNKNSERSIIFDIKNMSLDESSMGCEQNHKLEKNSHDEKNSQLKVSGCFSLHQTSRKANESIIDMQLDVISPTRMGDPICQATIINEDSKQRQTLYFNNDADIVSENLMDISNEKSSMENVMLKPNKQRQTLHFTKNNDMSLDNFESTNKSNDQNTLECMKQQQLSKDRQFSIISDVTKSKPLNAAKFALRRQAAMRFKSLSSELEDSLTMKLNETRAATFSSGKKKTLHLPANNGSSLDISPMPNRQEERERMRKLCEGTPHRSVIEFEYLEREANIEQQLFEQNEQFKQTENMNESEVEIEGKEDEVGITNILKPLSKIRRQTTYEHTDIVLNESGIEPLENCNVVAEYSNTMNESPIVNELTKKRLTANLTPIFQLSKKRQTLLFNDCNIEESFVSKNKMKQTNLLDRKNKHNTIRQTLFQKSMILSNSGVKYEDDEKDEDIPMYITSDGKSAKNTNELDATIQLDHTIQCENDVKVKTEIESPSNLIDVKHLLNNEDVPIDMSPACSSLSASRIPVRIGSVKKQSSITASFQSPIKLEETTENHSLAAIEIPRRATAFAQQKDMSIKLPMPDNGESLLQEQIKQDRGIVSVYEDNPITISDVSVFFLAQRQSIDSNLEDKTLLGHKKSPIISTQLQHPASNMILRKSSIDLCGDNTINRKANFKNYLNLSRNISLLSAEVDDIDQTRLSLVESLLYEDNDNSDSNDNKDEKSYTNEHKNEDFSAQVTENSKLSLRNLKTGTMCRKCKRCQETLLGESISSATDSFALPPIPLGSGLNWDRLEKLRKRPTLADVHEYWRRKRLELSFDVANLSTDVSNLVLEDEDEEEDVEAEADSADILIQNYKQKVQRMEEEMIVRHLKAPIIIRESFVQRLNKMLCKSSTNWIFDYQMQYHNVLQFSHKKIITFHILITYEEIDLMGKDIQIRTIELQSSRFSKKMWQPIDFVMDFQLKLELPFNLKSMCDSSDDVSLYKMLQQIDRICVVVSQLGNELWRIVRFNEASLIRDANRTYVRKIIREVITMDDEYPRVKKSEFLIEVTNVKKLSCKNISSPPLYSFRDDIEFIPSGLEFLRIFLNNPSAHLNN